MIFNSKSIKTKIFIFFIFSIPILACNQKEAIKYYNKALKNSKKEIYFLEKSLNSCYSPEAEANLLILKAKKSNNLKIKRDYYNKSLIPISQLKNPKEVLLYQNKINKTLVKIEKQIGLKDVAILRKHKIKYFKENEKNIKPIIILIFISVILYIIKLKFTKKIKISNKNY